MDTKSQPTTIVQDEKAAVKHDEGMKAESVKPGILENADYTGAEAKTDPAEIALVRKIDWRLMVTYSRNTLSNFTDETIAYVMYDVLPKLRW